MKVEYKGKRSTDALYVEMCHYENGHLIIWVHPNTPNVFNRLNQAPPSHWFVDSVHPETVEVR